MIGEHPFFFRLRYVSSQENKIYDPWILEEQITRDVTCTQYPRLIVKIIPESRKIKRKFSTKEILFTVRF